MLHGPQPFPPLVGVRRRYENSETMVQRIVNVTPIASQLLQSLAQGLGTLPYPLAKGLTPGKIRCSAAL